MAGESTARDVGLSYMQQQAGVDEDGKLAVEPKPSGTEEPKAKDIGGDGEKEKSPDISLDMSKLFDGKYKDMDAANLAWTEQERTLGRMTTEAKEAQTKLSEMTQLVTALQEKAGGDPKAFMDLLKSSNLKVSGDAVAMPKFDFPEDFDADLAKVMTSYMKAVISANNQNQANMFKEAIAPLLSVQEAAKVKDLVPIADDPAMQKAIKNAEADIASGNVSRGELAAALAVTRNLDSAVSMTKKHQAQKEAEKAGDGNLPTGDKPAGDKDDKDKLLDGETYIKKMSGRMKRG